MNLPHFQWLTAKLRTEARQKGKTPQWSGALRVLGSIVARKSGSLMAAVVFVAVDPARLAVLLAVDLLLFLRGQLAAVGGTIVANFVVDLRFVLLQVSRFPGS
ncbi:MAG: hypothetical protein ABR881_12235 [Candidatus Sulfotelmatobacter sp.]|jgi:hypothetical protein